MSPIVLRSSK